MALITLTKKSQFWYIIKHDNKKKRQTALTIPIFLSIIVNKKVMHFYN